MVVAVAEPLQGQGKQLLWRTAGRRAEDILRTSPVGGHSQEESSEARRQAGGCIAQEVRHRRAAVGHTWAAAEWGERERMQAAAQGAAVLVGRRRQQAVERIAIAVVARRIASAARCIAVVARTHTAAVEDTRQALQVQCLETAAVLCMCMAEVELEEWEERRSLGVAVAAPEVGQRNLQHLELLRTQELDSEDTLLYQPGSQKILARFRDTFRQLVTETKSC